MAGHGGGAWKVAYADFVTAMMAFFMVMWITAQSRPVKTAIAQYFKNPYGSANNTKGEYLYMAEKPGETSLMIQPEIGLGGGDRSHGQPSQTAEGRQGKGSRLAEAQRIRTPRWTTRGGGNGHSLRGGVRRVEQRRQGATPAAGSYDPGQAEQTRNPRTCNAGSAAAGQPLSGRLAALLCPLPWSCEVPGAGGRGNRPHAAQPSRRLRAVHDPRESRKAEFGAWKSTSSPSASRTLPARPKKEPSVSKRPNTWFP